MNNLLLKQTIRNCRDHERKSCFSGNKFKMVNNFPRTGETEEKWSREREKERVPYMRVYKSIFGDNFIW